jgi:hypothetical protein
MLLFDERVYLRLEEIELARVNDEVVYESDLLLCEYVLLNQSNNKQVLQNQELAAYILNNI